MHSIQKWIVIVVVVICVFGVIASSTSSDTDSEKGTDSNPKKSTTTDSGSETASTDTVETEEAEETVFVVGDVVETSNFHITYISAEQYVSTEEYASQPSDGNVFYRLEFEFENIGSSDEYVSYYDFDCYADKYAADIVGYIDSASSNEMLSATISPGMKTKGAVYIEVPQDAQEIIVEYETNYWTEDKVKFVVTN